MTTRITNAELLAELRAMRQDAAADSRRNGERIEAIVARLEEVLRHQTILHERVERLSDDAEETDKRLRKVDAVLFGKNGGTEKPGLVQRVSALEEIVQGTMKALRRAAWTVVASFLAGLGAWLAHLAGLKW